MAKRKKSGGVRRFYQRARRASKKSAGLGSLVKYAIGGAVYAGAQKVASMVPFGIDARIKRLLVIAILWMIGGVARTAAYVGVAFEVYGLVAPMLSSISLPGIAASSGGF